MSSSASPDEIIVNGRIAGEGIDRREWWILFSELFKDLGILNKRYRVHLSRRNFQATSGFVDIDSPNIAIELGHYSDIPSLSVQSVDGSCASRRQKINVSPRAGRPCFMFSLGNDYASDLADSIVNHIALRFAIVNVVSQKRSFRSPQQVFRTMPESDLRKATALINERDGYYEGVSAEMWLGEPFWQYASCSKEDVLNADWLAVEDRGSHLHVVAWPEPFTSAEGEQGEVQLRLLKLLFGIG